nr:reverse transcriptase domain-containing protein [Tanacetum cinerariifolium]
MSTRSSTRNIFPPLDNPEITIRRRPRVDPNILNDFELAAEGNGDLPVLDLRTMEELCQPFLNGRGGPIAPIATVGQTQNVYASGAYQGNSNQPQGNRNLISYRSDNYLGPPGNTITNPKEELKGITTLSGTAYQGPTIPTTSSSLPPTESLILNYEPIVAPIIEPVAAPVSAPKPNQKLSIPYPSRLHDQKLRDKANDQREKFFQIFKDLIFNISFVDALILMPKFGPTIKTLLTNKDKLSELVRTLLNEHCSAVLLKKLPEKLGDLGKFLIPCDFPGMAECLALADLGARINLMPLSVWNKLSLPDLSPTCMTLKLTDRSISHFDADHRVPLILERSFLKTERALIDVFEGELTLRVGKEAITFNLDQTSRYSANYKDMTAKRIDVIDMACEEYSQEVLGFSDVITSGNPTPYYEPDYDPTSPEVDQSYVDTEGDILLLEAFLNDDPSLPPPNQGNYLPQVRKELKIFEAKTDKSSIDEPPEVELKDLPPHLEYAFLQGDDKFPVIIAKYLSVDEKAALIMVLKSHKQAIAWKLSNIKCIDPEFYTHKILMEEDFEPAVQYQRRVNPKIHYVIKNEVLKLLDAGLIYPISDSLWVSPVNYVSKKGGFTVVENEENELILTRLVTGWRVCIDYRKLNEATRKDHFPLPFMDQMLERLAGNDYYCFLDGFSGYFQIPIDPKDQEKPHSLVHTECLPTVACLLGYAMHRARFRDTNLCLNWEKSHFMVKEGIVLGHKISKNGVEVDKAKVKVIAKLPHPTIVKGIRSFLGHAGFYRRFIEDFSKIAQSMTHLLKKDTPFFFSKECVEAFQTLKRKLTEAPILIVVDWDLPFELMCDASDFAIGAVLGQQRFQGEIAPLGLLLQEFTFKVIDTKGAENLAADHISQLENPHQNVLNPKEINESFPLATLDMVSSRGNSSTPWFANFANYHARNFVVKGMSSPTEKKFFKDVEAKALRTNAARVVCKFLKNLIARFGTPCAINSDRGMHFYNDQFAKVMLKYGVTHRLATPYHPQTRGQVEVSNRSLKRILKRIVGENRATWSDRLDDAL